ncbi:MAG: tetraacyldisaccharide 4'-kinase, partial [Muribaculaceae bacterium]|nr:tetraacyldisaccharide 4'-kinase [Muribaculaceae bacterium]
MKKRGILSTCILKPMSLAYSAGVTVRNKMFDYGILRQHEFDIPVVVIGNIAIGGTGKTPHTEYLINLLRYKYNIGVLSRGYKRKTKGFVMATAQSTARDIGDESYQIYRKFNKNVTVAVCED